MLYLCLPARYLVRGFRFTNVVPATSLDLVSSNREAHIFGVGGGAALPHPHLPLFQTSKIMEEWGGPVAASSRAPDRGRLSTMMQVVSSIIISIVLALHWNDDDVCDAGR